MTALGQAFDRGWVGDIVVFTGILPVAKDEHGLAGILGHGKSPFLR